MRWAGGRVCFEEVSGSGIPCDLMQGDRIELRCREGGERLKPHAFRPRRRLHSLLQEAALPPWMRESLPLLWIGNRLAWVGGIGIDAECACGPGEPGVLPVWIP